MGDALLTRTIPSRQFLPPPKRKTSALSEELKKRRTPTLSGEPKKRKTSALSEELKKRVNASCPAFLQKEIVMEKLRIYRIRDGFIEFLHEKDHRVQFNKRERRPYIGVVLEINGHKYIAETEPRKAEKQCTYYAH